MVLQSLTHDPCPGRTPGLRPTIRTHPETGQTAAARRKALKESCHNIQWLSLNVLDCQNGCPLDQHGTVTFEAHWRDRERREGVLRESSRIARGEYGEWLYFEALSLGDVPVG
jgi:SEC-C motif-containing protein